MLSEFLLVRARHIQLLNRLLDVLHTSSLLFVKDASLFFEALGAGSPVSFKLLLMVLVDSKLSKLKLAFFILTEQSHLLRLALEFAIVLLNQSILVILQLNLALLI